MSLSPLSPLRLCIPHNPTTSSPIRARINPFSNPESLSKRVESNYLTLAGLSLEILHPPALRTFLRGNRLMMWASERFGVSAAGSDKRQRDQGCRGPENEEFS
jgi:hypothetical protein